MSSSSDVAFLIAGNVTDLKKNYLCSQICHALQSPNENACYSTRVYFPITFFGMLSVVIWTCYDL